MEPSDAMAFDLIIRGGTVIDGTGAPARPSDVGVVDGRIAAVEPMPGAEAEEIIDATGRIVAPGFVDLHGHYDGQMTWDDLLEPSTRHGVTTLLMGNCGVGFAPVSPGREGELIELMEGVEDIPGAALRAGMTWGWETFSQYLDLLAGRRWSVDIGTQLPHGAVRSYVMGDRSGGNATSDDVAAMATVVREAIEAGALGFTTSRTLAHKAVNGQPVPGTYAGEDELLALAGAICAGGGRIFEVAGSGLAPIDDPARSAREVDSIGRLAAATGLTTTFVLLQCDDAPTRWQDDLGCAAAWRGRGARVLPLIAGRSAGVLWSWDVRHPFSARPSYRAIAHLPQPERLAQLHRPRSRLPSWPRPTSTGISSRPATASASVAPWLGASPWSTPPTMSSPPRRQSAPAPSGWASACGSLLTTNCSATGLSCCSRSTTTPPATSAPCTNSSRIPMPSSASTTVGLTP